MRKNRIAILLFLFVICCGIGIYKLDGIKTYFSSKREYKTMHEKTVDLSDYEPLEDEEDAWYLKYHFISHAGGGIAGKTYTNSIQAWELSYENGNRVFDADLAFTTDGVLVLRHSWDDNLEQGVAMKDSDSFTDKNGMPREMASQEQMDYDTFISTKIYYKYDPMSCEDMLKFMASHTDLYIAADMKDDIVQSYQYLVDTAEKLNVEEVLDRIIVNIYDYDTYEPIMEIYDFKNVTARQHPISPDNYYELVQFCITHNVHVINISSYYINEEDAKLFREYGIHCYVAISDYISDMQNYYKMGVDGAVTNWLYESDWKYIESEN
jgi:glycerophosphoryl diester phosphodiesterase